MLRIAGHMKSTRCFGCGALLLLALAGRPAHAQDRLARRFTSAGEIMLGGVRSLAQDSVGFLWLGTNGGLMRWDGIELRRWATGQLDTWINYMSVCPNGTASVVEDGATLFEIGSGGAQVVPGPGGGPFVGLRIARCDALGQLWAAAGAAVWRRDQTGTWHEAAPGTFAADAPFLIQGPQGPGVWVRTARAL